MKPTSELVWSSQNHSLSPRSSASIPKQEYIGGCFSSESREHFHYDYKKDEDDLSSIMITMIKEGGKRSVAQKKNRTRQILFPRKLRRVLDDAIKEENQHLICWLPNGHSFKIGDPEEFTAKILKRYFRQPKFKSFTRQL